MLCNTNTSKLSIYLWVLYTFSHCTGMFWTGLQLHKANNLSRKAKDLFAYTKVTATHAISIPDAKKKAIMQHQFNLL